MALFNKIFKRKKEEKKERKEKQEKRKQAELEKLKKIRKKQKDKSEAPEKTEEKKAEKGTVKVRKGEIKIAPRVLVSAHITEKATDLQDNNQYVFKVFKSSTKPEIKKAVEEFYQVNVTGIRVINVPRKRKRLGRNTGFKQGYKKAVVSLKKGQTIEILPR